MASIHQPDSSQQSSGDAPQHELTWAEVRELGIDPAPVGMTEADEQA